MYQLPPRKKLGRAEIAKARQMHAEMMKDPEYAATWNRLLEGIGDVLCDPEFSIPTEDDSPEST